MSFRRILVMSLVGTVVALLALPAVSAALTASATVTAPLGQQARVVRAETASAEATLPSTSVSYTRNIEGTDVVYFEGSYTNDRSSQVEDVFVLIDYYDANHVFRERVAYPTNDYILAAGESGSFGIGIVFASPMPYASGSVAGVIAAPSVSLRKTMTATVTTTSVDADGVRHYTGTVKNDSSVGVSLADVVVSGVETNGATFVDQVSDHLRGSLAPGASAEFELLGYRAVASSVTPTLGHLRADAVYPTVLALKANTKTPAYGTPVKLTATLTNASSGSAIASQSVSLDAYSATSAQKPWQKWVGWTAPTAYYGSHVTYYGADFDAMYPGDSNYAFAQSPSILVKPKVYLTKPYAPTSARKGAPFTSYGYLKPRHSTYTKIQAYRYQSGKWVLRKTFSAKDANSSTGTSKYSAGVSLGYTGSWRLRAYQPADTYHAATYTSYRSVRVY